MEFGKIKWFYDDKNFGFIEIIGNKDINFKKKDVRYKGIRPGDMVRFSMRFDSNSRPYAINVEKLEQQQEFTDWDEIEKIRKTPIQILLKSAELALKEAHYGKARQKYQNCISHSEWHGLRLDEAMFVSYGEMEYRLGRYKEAKEVYELGRKHCPSSSKLVSKVAKIYIKEQRFEEAEKLLTQFINNYSADDGVKVELLSGSGLAVE